MNGLLKRKYDEVDEDPCYSSSPSSSSSSASSGGWDSDEESSSSEALDSRSSIPSTYLRTKSILKTTKRRRRCNVKFDQVIVFFFPRCQGFTSVPSRGGCTLGMVKQHSMCRQYTLDEFAQEQLHQRREKLKERLKEEKVEALRQKLTKNGTRQCEEADRLTTDDIPEDDIDITGIDLEEACFLHPYPSKKRHALLKTAGVKKIDKEEKRELHAIRVSREDCGCSCQGFCEPETCSCSIAGIKCQMDHSSFPCGCTKDGCGNTEGRIEFNSSRVQTHYIHTIMKLELEKRLDESHDASEPFGKHLPQQHNSFFACPVDSSHDTTSSPPFHFTPELDATGDNSCSSDMTDSSSSSGQSEDSENPCEASSPDPEKPQSDVDDNGLARILSFNDSDNDDCSSSRSTNGEQQQKVNLRSFSSSDFLNDNIPEGTFSVNNGGQTDNHVSCVSDYLDENANQDSALFHSSDSSQNNSSAPASSDDHATKSYMDLSLSSDSDLEFFHSFPDYSPSPLYNCVRECENLDSYFQFQFPSFPSFPQASDQGTCFLESLIGLSESVPEPPAAFTDNLLLEEAIKSPMMESVKV
ncbi:cysteine/serine-rich nuclear protein 1b [Erpetoichthys calabaricus]|uniref:Cysteine-serine-rich nuclear protein 1b n=1 Tax=Erpetoichthys calabaricus TaxID=27687 RepID=A0A8C4X5L5_ERPCA|nr:cysteine/serine-rich nuclear protein 1b [Erpetoichthys calabaricus]XP_051785296.1 cysteine/serine-rich nuclear protein 1b [Erpetoichthys calabaricus]XP_051785297.1 cysteine/serine-rich nuclear protein 1b [Erpetoichthys calabaricus]XP_051785298.1 cysteine/serine-rich nuclear protein 1b [Erpetoichthys calabaricus]